MKRWIAILALVLMCGMGHAQKSILSGTVSGVEAGTRLVVSEAKGGRLVPVDTLTLDSKGKFKVERTMAAQPDFLSLSLLLAQSPTVHAVLLPKEKVTVDMRYVPEFHQMKIESCKGSENMEVYRQYNNMMVESLSVPEKRATMGQRMEELLKENKEVLMSAFLVTYFESAFEQYAYLYRELRDALIGKYPDNDFVRHLDSKLRAAIVAGMEAPDIELPDVNGELRRLSDLRGKVVLIDFWASWCRPCRMENPNVVKLYQRFHDKGFEIYSVSLDNNKLAWENAIRADGLAWPNHVSDLRGWSSAGGRLYGIQSIPATVLVDREGKVLARNLRGGELERKLTEIFDGQ